MKEHVDVLMLEDAPVDAELIEQTLRRGGLNVDVQRVETRDAFAQALEDRSPDVIVTDHGLPAFDSLRALSMALAKRPEVPVIVVTASPDDEMTLQALQSGATEYVSKNHLSHLVPRVKRVLEAAEKQTELAHLRQALSEVEERSRLLESGMSNSAIYLLDAEGRITWGNGAGQAMHGFTEPEMLGQTIARLLPSEQQSAGWVEQRLGTAKARGRVEDQGWSMRRDGSRFWAHWIFTAGHEPNGEARGFAVVVRDLMERPREVKALRPSEARQEAIMELSQDAAISIDSRGILQEWSGAAENMFGYSQEQAVGREFVTLIIPPSPREELRSQLRVYLDSGGKERFLGRWFTMQRADGSEFPAEFTLRPVGTQPGRFAGYVRDITRVKEAEGAWHELESHYRLAVEHATEYAIYMLDPEGRVASWNKGAERIEGYSAEEIIGQHFSIFFTPEDREEGKAEQELRRAASQGSSISEAWSVRKDGSRFLCRWALNAVREQGKLLGFSRVAHDVTQLRQTQEKLRRSEERLRLTLEAVHDYAIYMLDAEGRVASYNAGASRLEGYQPEEIIGKPLHTFFTPEDIARGVPDQELERARREGKSRREGWNVRKDGSRFHSDWVLNAIRDEHGKLTGFSKVARDVTDLKQAEEKIQRWNAELEARVAQRTRELETTNKELEAFSYSVSHDLRAPLRHINAFIHLLEDALGASIPPEAREYLQAVADSAQHMGHLVDDLLTFSRMGRQEMRRVPIRLMNLVREAQVHLQSDIGQRHIEWVIDELPEVEGDPATLRQVFINLLSNALKYTMSRPQARIEFGCRDSPGETVCFIRDNGVGFDPRYAHKLFGVFQRLHSPQQFEGTGIGLAIVRRVIERHGGRVWAEGEVDQGASFYFSLPKTTHSPKA